MDGQILVPLDGSRLAEQALSCAVTLARAQGAELVLLRAIWVPPDAVAALRASLVTLDEVTQRLEAEADAYMAPLVEALRDAGIKARHVVPVAPPAEAILDYAQQEEVGQIVMATHGYSGLKRWTHGSVAERVLQAAQVPLLLVRSTDEAPTGDWLQAKGCRRILVPLDGSPLAEQILPLVTDLARSLGSSLTLLQVPITHASEWMTGEWYFPVQGVVDTVQTDAQAYLDAVASELGEQGLEVTTALAVGAVAGCIVDYAGANQIDLIAMCTHGRTGLARWALGSVADHVLRAGTAPILLWRARQAAP